MRALLICKGGLNIVSVAAEPGSARGRDGLSMRVRQMKKWPSGLQESGGGQQQVGHDAWRWLVGSRRKKRISREYVVSYVCDGLQARIKETSSLHQTRSRDGRQEAREMEGCVSCQAASARARGWAGTIWFSGLCSGL